MVAAASDKPEVAAAPWQCRTVVEVEVVVLVERRLLRRWQRHNPNSGRWLVSILHCNLIGFHLLRHQHWIRRCSHVAVESLAGTRR